MPRLRLIHLVFAVLVCVSMLPLAIFAVHVTRAMTNEEVQQQILIEQQTAESMGNAVAVRTAHIREALEQLSAAVSRSSANGNPIATKALLQQAVNGPEHLAYVEFRQVGSATIHAGYLDMDEEVTAAIDRVATAGAKAFTAGESVPVRSGFPQSMILLSTPSENGSLIAALDASHFMREMVLSSGSDLRSYLLNEQGEVIAFNGPSSETLAGHGPSTSPEDAFPQAARQEEVKSNPGVSAGVPGINWTLVVNRAGETSFTWASSMRRDAVLLGLLSVALSIALAIALTRTIARPLAQLEESSRAMARGDFGYRFAIDGSTEIADLARNFNDMKTRLGSMVGDLARVARENRQLFLELIQMIAAAVDDKDPYTRGHAERVTRYSVAIAEELGLPADEIEKVRVSALLHDVGKIGIDDQILKKPGLLTPEEFEIMKAHPVKGANILRSIDMLKEMIPGVELHHESLDGRGYPYGLKGDQIPLMPRIIAVADTFDAMTTSRPYQSSMAPEYVLHIMERMVGTKFCPVVVAAFGRAFAKGAITGVGLLHERSPIEEILPVPMAAAV